MKKRIVRKWIFIFGFSLFSTPLNLSAQNVQQQTYVGIEKCKTCHAEEYKAFHERQFDMTWKVLMMRKESKNPECLKCHTTGYGKPGGFVDAETTPHLKYKQCEACHGPGGPHVSDPTNKEKGAEMRNYIRERNVCIECHVRMKTHRLQVNY